MPNIDMDLLTRLMADFEQGNDIKGEPFDLFEPDGPEPGEVVTFVNATLAFCEDAARMTAASGGTDPDQFAHAGFLQGLVVGAAYTREKEIDSA